MVETSVIVCSVCYSWFKCIYARDEEQSLVQSKFFIRLPSVDLRKLVLPITIEALFPEIC